MAKVQKKGAATRTRRRERKNIEKGAAHIRSSFNNTIVTITDLNGNAISRTYQNALYSVGHDLYAGWVKDRTYEYIYCPSGSTARVLYTVTGQTPAQRGTW